MKKHTKIEQNIKNKLYALLCVATITSALIVNLHWHEHEKCLVKNGQHIHQVKKTCSEIQINLEFSVFNLDSKPNFIVPNFRTISTVIIVNYLEVVLLNSSRGPPFFVA